MRNFLLLLALVSVHAFAQASYPSTPSQKFSVCAANSSAFLVAAGVRNEGKPPEEAFEKVKKDYGKQLTIITVDGDSVSPDQLIKNLVNSVYFNKNFAGPRVYSIVQDLRLQCQYQYQQDQEQAMIERQQKNMPQYAPLK